MRSETANLIAVLDYGAKECSGLVDAIKKNAVGATGPPSQRAVTGIVDLLDLISNRMDIEARALESDVRGDSGQ